MHDINIAESELLEIIMRQGVKVGPGQRYFANSSSAIHFRLSIACVAERQIEIACQLLGRALADALA